MEEGPRVVVAGFLADGLGLGQAARGYAHALAVGGCDVSLHVLSQPGKQIGHGDPGGSGTLDLPRAGADAEADVVVVCANPPELAAWRDLGTRLPAGRVTVGIWAYEVDPVPRTWAEPVTRFDELWVNCEFIADLLRLVVDVPIAAIPPAPLLGEPTPCDLVPHAPPSFVALCDNASTLARKNPAGAIEAFRRAFAPGEGPRLLVKLWNGHLDTTALDRLRTQAARDRDDIAVVDRWLPRPEFVGLLRDSLGLVSLHRAEGFGLPIVEALALGVPVVCTDATGVVDLLDNDTAFLVRSTPAAVGPDVPAYPPEGTWREPDLDHAAEQLRRVWDDPDERARRAAAAQRFAREHFDAGRIGERLRARVDALLAGRARRISPRSPFRPSVSVVVHAAEPWPSLQPFLDAVVPQLADVDGELVVGASAPDVLPESRRPDGVRVVAGPSRSPFDLRAAALTEVDGGLVVVTEDHVAPCASWLVEYAEAHRATGAILLSGPVANGSGDTAADWANYLINFAAYAPPIDDLPSDRCPTVANCAVDGFRLRAAVGGSPRPGEFERDVVPSWWAAGDGLCVPGAAVQHVQPNVGWRHVLAHFDDARTAGAHAPGVTSWQDFTPSALQAICRIFLRTTAAAIADRPELAEQHRAARWWLRALAAAKALGLASGAHWGAGHSAIRLD